MLSFLEAAGRAPRSHLPQILPAGPGSVRYSEISEVTILTYLCLAFSHIFGDVGQQSAGGQAAS